MYTTRAIYTPWTFFFFFFFFSAIRIYHTSQVIPWAALSRIRTFPFLRRTLLNWDENESEYLGHDTFGHC
jgi:hypothetical protein